MLRKKHMKNPLVMMLCLLAVFRGSAVITPNQFEKVPTATGSKRPLPKRWRRGSGRLRKIRTSMFWVLVKPCSAGVPESIFP